MTLDWEWKTQGSSREKLRSVSSYTGCSSLVNMAVRSALVHSISITAETLEGLPWEIASRLWEQLVASYARSWHLAGAKKANKGYLHRKLVSVKVWKAFAAAYPNQPVDALKRKHHVITRPNMKLGDYVAPLISPSLQWITFLSLSNIACVRDTSIYLSSSAQTFQFRDKLWAFYFVYSMRLRRKVSLTRIIYVSPAPISSRYPGSLTSEF